MNNDQINPMEVLEVILNSLVTNTISKEELIKLWFHIGRLMGVEEVFPEMQVITTPDERGDKHPILLVGTTSSFVADYLTDPNILTQEIARLCLKEIKEEVYH
jgi:hypothetical protein